MTLDQFLQHFHHVRPHGPDRWTAQCPAHEDRSHDTLALRHGDRHPRPFLAYCFAGCDLAAVLQAVGLELHQCFEDGWPARPPRRLTYAEMIAQSYRDIAREHEQRYGRWREFWEECDLIREERCAADRLRAWATTLDPEQEITWKILEFAALLETDAANLEARQDDELRTRR